MESVTKASCPPGPRPPTRSTGHQRDDRLFFRNDVSSKNSVSICSGSQPGQSRSPEKLTGQFKLAVALMSAVVEVVGSVPEARSTSVCVKKKKKKNYLFVVNDSLQGQECWLSCQPTGAVTTDLICVDGCFLDSFASAVN